MNKRKIILVAVALCMVAILAAGSTLAYFMDTETAKNTMVIGNIEIDIDEWTYMPNDKGVNEWKPFVDDEFTMYPIDNKQGINLNNKMVYTANVSKSEDDAYIRTIVLIEKNDLLDETYVNDGECCFPGIHYYFRNTAEPVQSGTDGKIYYGAKEVNTNNEVFTIDGNEYYAIVFVEAKERAIPYDAALNSLSSVWLDKNLTIDKAAGWGEDGKVDIIVFSQGIQATGLTHTEAMAALGAVNQENLTNWIKGESTDFDADDWTTKTLPAATTPAEGE